MKNLLRALFKWRDRGTDTEVAVDRPVATDDQADGNADDIDIESSFNSEIFGAKDACSDPESATMAETDSDSFAVTVSDLKLVPEDDEDESEAGSTGFDPYNTARLTD